MGHGLGRGVLLGALLAGASFTFFGGASRTEVAAAPAPIVPAACVVLDGRGGELAHEGARLVVPQGALREAAELRMQGTALPAPLAKGFRPASRVLRLTKASEERFEKPVSVTLPVDADTRIDETVALYWDVEHRLYRTLTVTRRDEVARTVTFETIHFTDFLVTTPDDEDMKDPRAPLAATDTGFTPQEDAFFFTNGDYDSSGTCLGMSLLSSWYYETHRSDPEAANLHDLMTSFGPVAQTADFVGREMALLAQRAAIPLGEYLAKPSKAALDEAKRVGPIQSGVALWDALRVTGTPQLIVIQGPYGAHAIVAYAYVDGAFLIYDPNYPLEVKHFPFDRVRGFHDFDGTNLGTPLEVAPVSFSSYAADVDFEKIFERALADRGQTDRYRSVAIESAEDVKGKLVVRGRVSGGIAAPRDSAQVVRLVVGAREFDHARLRSDGSFELDARLDEVVRAALEAHMAPAVLVQEQPWSFAGASRVALTAPSTTAGINSALGLR